ncbi:MAG TPA: ribonuclease P protein component [Candidatus Paceibacterota bacterium]|nr:ribonuclease P protein component [Candidatus Paceibacterota bacterium]
MALPRKHRLTQKEFAELFASGRRVRGASCSLQFRITGSGNAKFGVSVRSAVAPKATVRNRIRRTVTEAVRPLVPRFSPGTWVAAVIHSPAHRDAPQRYGDEIAGLLRKSGIITP